MLMPQNFFKNELIDVPSHFRKVDLEYDAENAFIILAHLHREWKRDAGIHTTRDPGL